jgi:transcriptional regulator with XRE-family HTH domain
MSDFSETLRRLMDDANLTQQEVAIALGISQRAVSGWLQGSKPRSGKMRRLADFFDVPVEVLEGKAPMPEAKSNELDEPKAVYGRLQALPKGDVSGFAALIESMPESDFKDRMIDSVFKGVTDAIFAVAEEEIELSSDLAKALTRKDFDVSSLADRFETYRMRQANTAKLAEALNASAGLDLPIPKDADSIKREVIDYLEQRLNGKDRTA